MAATVQEDSGKLYANQEPVNGPITMYEAMARALKYNLDHRLKLMESALGRHRLTSANLNLLPRLMSEASLNGRDNYNAASSESITSGEQSLESSFSQDRTVFNYSLEMSWNVLDFGLTYVRAQQESDRTYILEERRRKVVHNIIQDVRQAYWRAASAQSLLTLVTPLTERVNEALVNARTVEENSLLPPRESLTYIRDLLQLLRKMESLRNELNAAKISLATLMNLPPDTDYTLVAPASYDMHQAMAYNLKQVEQYALLHRPEMREEVYQERISRKDVVREILRTLPGIEVTGGWNYDSNTYLYHDSWWSWSSVLTGNLLDIVTAPSRIATAEAQQDVVKTRRMALSMAVLSQVRIAWLNYEHARRDFGLANELHAVVGKLLDLNEAEVALRSAGELSAVKSKVDAVVTQLIRDNAYADMQAAMGRFYLSAGANLMPEAIESHDLATLAAALQKRDTEWMNGATDFNNVASPQASARTSADTVAAITAPPVANPTAASVHGADNPL